KLALLLLIWLPVPVTRIPLPVLPFTVAPETLLLFPVILMPSLLLGPVVPPLRVLELPFTRIPPGPPLPLTSFQLTVFPSESIRMPQMLAPLARTLFKVCGPPEALLRNQPLVPPTESGPTINSLPVLVMFQTGLVLSAAVIWAEVHWVIFRDFGA